MKYINKKIMGLIGLVHTIKVNNLRWQSENQTLQLKLSHERILAEKDLAALLSKKSLALAHEIELLKTRQANELAMLKTRCQEDIKDYRQYLAALDMLKQDIRTGYSNLPEAIAHTIHHHAKSMLNNMWETTDFEEKTRLESQLIQFMSTAHEETTAQRAGNHKNALPENTLRLIKQDQHQEPAHFNTHANG